MSISDARIIDLVNEHMRSMSTVNGLDIYSISRRHIINFAHRVIEEVAGTKQSSQPEPSEGKGKRAAPMWVVKGKGPASYIHGSEAYALQEAKRLAANHPGEQFTVMVSTRSFVALIEEIDRSYEDDGIPF